MDSDRNQSPVDGGHAAEHQPLLPSPLSVNGHRNVNTAINIEDVAAQDFGISTLLESRTKLSASALNFFLSGIAMAAVGVSIAFSPCTSEAR